MERCQGIELDRGKNIVYHVCHKISFLFKKGKKMSLEIYQTTNNNYFWVYTYKVLIVLKTIL